MAAIPHKKQLPNLDDVHSIGIVLPHESTADELRILQFFNNHMAKRDIVVTYYRHPSVGDKENLTRTGLPTPTYLSTFVSHTYDLIIAATPASDDNTLHAVLSTPARLRVAYDDTSMLLTPLTAQTYDLFIRGTGPCDLTNYLREILLLLTNIKK